MSLKRILKRFKREHRPKTPKTPKWVFHKETWGGDFEVSVMPRSIDGRVEDSNTGVVLKAPLHGALKACVIVKDGRRPNCDEAALNYTLTGDRNKYWADRDHPWCMPRRRVSSEDRERAAYQMAVTAMMEGQGYERQQAEGIADRVLGWGPDSMPCFGCHLVIPGVGAMEIVAQAREYGWKVRLPLTHDSWRCATCAKASDSPIPTDDEMLALCGPGEYI